MKENEKECSDIYRSWESPFSGHKESAKPAADAQKINWNLTFPRIYIQFLFEYSIEYRQHVIYPIIGFPVIKLCIGINSKRYLGVNERSCHKFCKYDLLVYRIIISVIIIPRHPRPYPSGNVGFFLPLQSIIDFIGYKLFFSVPIVHSFRSLSFDGPAA